jgi:hypothetical protein
VAKKEQRKRDPACEDPTLELRFRKLDKRQALRRLRRRERALSNACAYINATNAPSGMAELMDGLPQSSAIVRELERLRAKMVDHIASLVAG